MVSRVAASVRGHAFAVIVILLFLCMHSAYAEPNDPPYFTNCPETYIAAECTLQVAYDFDAGDDDPGAIVRYSLGPGSCGSIDSVSGQWQWDHNGSTGLYGVTVIATDEFGEYDVCYFEVFVDSPAPSFTDCGGDSSRVTAMIGEVVRGTLHAVDPDGCPDPLTFSLFSFEGPGMFELDPASGDWTWRTHSTEDFIGDFNASVGVTDGFGSDSCMFTITVLPTFDIWIGNDLSHPQGRYAQVPIYVSDESDYMAGFDLLITYDGKILNFIDAALGEELGADGCRWEYFTYRLVNQSECSGSCPVHMLRFVAMAEADHKPPYPLCYGGDSIQLVNMRFLVSPAADFQCKFTPIDFYWIDCGDNTVSSVSGDTLWVSSHVYTLDGTFIPTYFEVTGTEGYGGHSGIPGVDCLEGNINGGSPVEGIIFRGGGIKTECIVDQELYGDLNLNRVPNEVSDAVLFLNYFIFGMSAFSIDPETQAELSDVNRDGRILTAGDFVYMVRIIVGDADLLMKACGSEEMSIISSPIDGNARISAFSDVDVGAVFFEFDVGDRDVTPRLLADQMQMKWGRVGDRLRVIVYSMSTDQIPAGSCNLLTLEGIELPALARVSASDYYGRTIYVKPNEESRESSFRLLPNRPNPFNPATEISFYSAKQENWSVEIYNITGQRVDFLSGTCVIGVNSVSWDATGHSSGLYLYRVTVGDESGKGKMILMK